MKTSRWLAVLGAALCVGFTAPVWASEDTDPHMKFYYPGAGFQHEDDYDRDRELRRQDERQDQKSGSSGSQPWQDPDKGKTQIPGGGSSGTQR